MFLYYLDRQKEPMKSGLWEKCLDSLLLCGGWIRRGPFIDQSEPCYLSSVIIQGKVRELESTPGRLGLGGQ